MPTGFSIRQDAMLLLGGVLVVCMWLGCQRQASQDRTMADVLAEEAPDEESWNVHFVVTQVAHDTTQSRPRFAVEAGYMARYTREDVEVISQDEDRLETETLEWVESEQRVSTPGFVRITTPTEQIQGYQLEAEEDLDTYRLAEITGRFEVEDG